MACMGKIKSDPNPSSENHSYQVEVFAEKHGLSLKAAKVILSSNGPSRTMCDAAAKAFVAAVAARGREQESTRA
ncbi:hypothetical protein MESS2_1620019 [Mesorhizobium metallidurans STM 2683]|uniref:Uncharacterized protein n=2 Tax=Mesorhizobium metallidurans TaxID=489722 RepID=M5ELM3_9HYPH|nr:hypothetical protein MESS2_1620019 [Mesorhizobium metallidurans STM 2683]